MIIKMKPMCDCGYIFRDLVVDRSISPGYHGVEIDPAYCPYCNEPLTGFTYQVPVQDRLEYEESKYKRDLSDVYKKGGRK